MISKLNYNCMGINWNVDLLHPFCTGCQMIIKVASREYVQ